MSLKPRAVCHWVHVGVVAPTTTLDFEFVVLAVAPVSVPIHEGGSQELSSQRTDPGHPEQGSSRCV
eukprot:10360508-Prorocentrum_lima.AAC.1